VKVKLYTLIVSNYYLLGFMPLLNNPYALIATTDLSIQIIVLFFLLYGYLLKMQMKFRQHGIAMLVAVVLHLAMLFSIMIPAFVLGVVPRFIVPNVYGVASVVTLVMGVIGALAVSLGTWLVASWRFQDVAGCFKKKRIMLATMAMWLVSLSLGIVLYIILYWAVILS